MRRTPYRIIIHQNVNVNSNYMEKLGSTIVSYLSELEYLNQKRDNPLFFTCPYTGASGSIDKLWLEHGYINSKEDLIGKINRCIYDFSLSTFHNPSIIIIHPETFENNIKWMLFGNETCARYDEQGKFYFQGIRFIRSTDIDRNDIKVY